ncbi:MAG: DUF5777 family beta-barrel protein [Maribacter sp.]
MNNYKIVLLAFLFSPILILSQEKTKDSIVDKPERPAFESSTLIDNQTNVLFDKNTLEVMMQHRFDEINSGSNNLAGIYGIANIRIALSYAIHDRLTIGFGTEKTKKYQDFNWKAGILRQTRSGKIPVSVSYYGNFVIDARNKDLRKNGISVFPTKQSRYSYFNQLIIARRFSPKLSLQIAPSVSHYNLAQNKMPNDVVAISAGGRYKISEQTAIMVDYSHPFVHHLNDAEFEFDPKPGFSLGVEFSTSGHAFQLFLSSNKGIVPQENYMYNQNEFFNGGTDILIGFNITRNYNF